MSNFTLNTKPHPISKLFGVDFDHCSAGAESLHRGYVISGTKPDAVSPTSVLDFLKFADFYWRINEVRNGEITFDCDYYETLVRVDNVKELQLNAAEFLEYHRKLESRELIFNFNIIYTLDTHLSAGDTLVFSNDSRTIVIHQNYLDRFLSDHEAYHLVYDSGVLVGFTLDFTDIPTVYNEVCMHYGKEATYSKNTLLDVQAKQWMMSTQQVNDIFNAINKLDYLGCHLIKNTDSNVCGLWLLASEHYDFSDEFNTKLLAA